MTAKLEELPIDNDDCFRDVAYDESFSDLQISLCGNGEVEIGEDCDCGMNIDILDKEIRGNFCFGSFNLGSVSVRSVVIYLQPKSILRKNQKNKTKTD